MFWFLSIGFPYPILKSSEGIAKKTLIVKVLPRKRLEKTQDSQVSYFSHVIKNIAEYLATKPKRTGISKQKTPDTLVAARVVFLLGLDCIRENADLSNFIFQPLNKEHPILLPCPYQRGGGHVGGLTGQGFRDRGY